MQFILTETGLTLFYHACLGRFFKAVYKGTGGRQEGR